MFASIRKGGALAAVMALALAGLGFTTPALADEVYATAPTDAKLTKVIVAPENTDTSGDTYTFHFAGDGEVVEQGDQLLSGAVGEQVEQDATTIKAGDVIPTIANYTMSGRQLSETNTLTNGQTYQTVRQVPLSSVLADIDFPHAGIYTYRVTESSTTMSSDKASNGFYVNASRASYTLRVRVANAEEGAQGATASGTIVTEVTVERTLDDDGRETSIGKVDSNYPEAPEGKITRETSTKVPAANTLAGDNTERGRDVYGFTFANEYMKGGEFVVKKLIDGTYGDKTKLFPVELKVHNAATTADNAKGACVTYVIEGEGVDDTENLDDHGQHKTLDYVYGIAQSAHRMAEFDPDSGEAIIKAELKEGSIIRVTGVFGPYAADYVPEGSENANDKRKTVSLLGLTAGEDFTVTESTPGEYVPTGYVYVGEETRDPRKADEREGMTATAGQAKTALVVTGETTGSATTIFVVNKLEDSSASLTGVFIDNLPYILMVCIPAGVFAVLFVRKHRMNAAA